MELVFKDGHAVTSDGQVGVVMLVTPREDIDNTGLIFRYFEYVAHFTRPPTRVEWDIDSMFAVLPKDTADFLVSRKYARNMTEQDVKAYNGADAATQPIVKPAAPVEPAAPAAPVEPAPIEKPAAPVEPAVEKPVREHEHRAHHKHEKHEKHEKPTSKKSKRGD